MGKRQTKKKKKKREGKTTKGKLDALLDQMPKLLENANAAALAHTEALAKWQSKYASSSDSSNE